MSHRRVTPESDEYINNSLSRPTQWRRHTRACQGKCPDRNTSVLAAAVKSANNKIIYQDIFSALADTTNDLPTPCHEQRTGAATVSTSTKP